MDRNAKRGRMRMRRTEREQSRQRFLLTMYIATSTHEKQATYRDMARLGVSHACVIDRVQELIAMQVITQDSGVAGSTRCRHLRVLPGWKEKVTA